MMMLVTICIGQLLATTPETRPFAVGLDAGVLMRQTGGGSRTPLFAAGPRVGFGLSERFGLSTSYTFSYTREGSESAASARSQFHRLNVRPEVSLAFTSTRFVVGLGPALHLTQTSLSDRGTQVSEHAHPRFAASGGLSVETSLSSLRVRMGATAAWLPGRLDYWFGAGIAYALGGG